MAKQKKVGGWKGLSSWVKGGIVLLFFDLLMMIVAYLYSFSCRGLECTLALGASLSPGYLITGRVIESITFLIFVNLLLFFVLGAIIGLIFGKIKSKKMKK